MSEPKAESVYVNPGTTVMVDFKCIRCEGYRWRAVSPGRNVKRAIAAIERGDDAADVIEWLEDALDDLSLMAGWEDSDAQI